MAELKWLPSFETGIEDIDSDHKELFRIILAIQDACGARDMELCETYFDSFLSKAEDHFRREETFLKSIDFPRVESHAAAHNHLLDHVRGTLDSLRGETDDDVIKNHIEDMIFYLLEDVIKADAEFKSYAREHSTL